MVLRRHASNDHVRNMLVTREEILPCQCLTQHRPIVQTSALGCPVQPGTDDEAEAVCVCMLTWATMHYNATEEHI